ncbi:hypothetical protein PHLGIDRAFT_19598 [Phlebiopsis gigantea 11061_1 CR5-6]|uniref:Protein BIG1 n=1 Tax=Phlebiopsis gigantea (strain 11061_1 CR5-6) TaxID=745531 RepID=A0A0C3S5V5_PHLG1|nr:hypothetical protein PHLGIDRAFT_19598 [Phlebiopsis gigantea 11061_1 CR5-6]
MVRGAIIAVALAQTVLAFPGTHPIVAWSSHNSNALASVGKSSNTGIFLERLLADSSICDHDAIVLVDQMGLHASDLRSLPSSSKIARSINSAPFSFEIPYMRDSTENPFLDIAGAIAKRCGSRILSISTGEVGPHLEDTSDKKHVVCMGMAPLEGSSESRKEIMAKQESQLASDIENISKTFSKYMVVYAGWNPMLRSRQDLEDGPALEFVAEPSPASPSKAAAPAGGVLSKYQLLTPGLIISLIVGLFVLLPVVFLGISSLASIQSPVRLDAPKGFNAAEKKNQ